MGQRAAIIMKSPKEENTLIPLHGKRNDIHTIYIHVHAHVHAIDEP